MMASAEPSIRVCHYVYFMDCLRTLFGQKAEAGRTAPSPSSHEPEAAWLPSQKKENRPEKLVDFSVLSECLGDVGLTLAATPFGCYYVSVPRSVRGIFTQVASAVGKLAS